MFQQGIVTTGKLRYLHPVGYISRIKTIRFHNYSNVSVLITMWSNVSADFQNGDIQIDEFQLEPNNTIEISPAYPFEYEVPNSGIVFNCNSANSVSYTIGGVVDAL